MKTELFDEITFTVESPNGAKVIIGIDNTGRVHSGAYSTIDPQPNVHQAEYQLEEKVFKEILEKFKSCQTSELQDNYSTKQDQKTELIIQSKGKNRKITISPQASSGTKVPVRLQSLLKTLGKLGKW